MLWLTHRRQRSGTRAREGEGQAGSLRATRVRDLEKVFGSLRKEKLKKNWEDKPLLHARDKKGSKSRHWKMSWHRWRVVDFPRLHEFHIMWKKRQK